MKRVYKTVIAHITPGGYEIHLDGKPVRMPGGDVLRAPTPILADALVLEWATQGNWVVPDSMKLTQLLTTALDRIARDRAGMTHATMAYLDTDLLCYRTSSQPLAEHQKKAWDPWLGWFAKRFGVALATTETLHALQQPYNAHSAARACLDDMSLYQFTAAQMVTSLTGSLVLALAFTEGAIAPQQAFDAARVEENYKAALYREDIHGAAPQQEKSDAAMLQDLYAAKHFLELTI